MKWCEENGADELSEIVEAKMEDEFVASLALKPVKAKVLKERISALMQQGQGEMQGQLGQMQQGQMQSSEPMRKERGKAPF